MPMQQAVSYQQSITYHQFRDPQQQLRQAQQQNVRHDSYQQRGMHAIEIPHRRRRSTETAVRSIPREAGIGGFVSVYRQSGIGNNVQDDCDSGIGKQVYEERDGRPSGGSFSSLRELSLVKRAMSFTHLRRDSHDIEASSMSQDIQINSQIESRRNSSIDSRSECESLVSCDDPECTQNEKNDKHHHHHHYLRRLRRAL
ncbi:hypothetical protein IW140_003586 [Coemansia sp. RSA 1813]|nr:hypothetical protein EV178_003445 [Coemansia sp. RSA 1646]KAJ1769323.1 hypothetical protein LPJ74_004150 [Coemansia sp. RSA 1843]KAJ2089105.1 hypothetical protein IW138_003685 [Coemansia sp. RSA 986]KAJ2215637.1 hypothetical protein EV179_002048 [Coemansia sp. RSA 487]KAJ2568829.1 hypothetical protein IW140_003586 [Coemansia sp. RSA 1813]